MQYHRIKQLFTLRDGSTTWISFYIAGGLGSIQVSDTVIAEEISKQEYDRNDYHKWIMIRK